MQTHNNSIPPGWSSANASALVASALKTLAAVCPPMASAESSGIVADKQNVVFDTLEVLRDEQAPSGEQFRD